MSVRIAKELLSVARELVSEKDWRSRKQFRKKHGLPK